MAYGKKVLDHYENPRNVGTLDKDDKSVGTGMVGAPACGDVMKLQIKVNEGNQIVDAKFKTFGCGSAIASLSLLIATLHGLSRPRLQKRPAHEPPDQRELYDQFQCRIWSDRQSCAHKSGRVDAQQHLSAESIML